MSEVGQVARLRIRQLNLTAGRRHRDNRAGPRGQCTQLSTAVGLSALLEVVAQTLASVSRLVSLPWTPKAGRRFSVRSPVLSRLWRLSLRHVVQRLVGTQFPTSHHTELQLMQRGLGLFGRIPSWALNYQMTARRRRLWLHACMR